MVLSVGPAGVWPNFGKSILLGPKGRVLHGAFVLKGQVPDRSSLNLAETPMQYSLAKILVTSTKPRPSNQTDGPLALNDVLCEVSQADGLG